jgi:hypothetical protein
MGARHVRLKTTLIEVQQISGNDLGEVGNELSAPRLVPLNRCQRLFFSSVASF